MTPTYSAVLALPIGRMGDNNAKENQYISLELFKEAQVKSYAIPVIHIVIQEKIKYILKIKQFYKLSFKSILCGLSFLKQVWEDVLDISTKEARTYDQLTFKPNFRVSSSDIELGIGKLV